VIDWSLAERVAAFVAQEPPAATPLPDLAPLAEEARERVVAYSGLVPATPLPGPEAVDRREWVAINLVGMQPLLDPLADRAAAQSPLGAPLRGVAVLAVSAQVGLVTGYLAQRVMGQYELALMEPAAPARLLFVTPNLDDAARALEADRDELVRWVAFHEVTHGVQFGAVGWLREHLAEILRELIADVEVSVDAAAVARLPSLADVRELIDAVREGGLVALVARGRRRELIDRLQATMALIEGYAEHVMDAAAQDVLPSLAALRAALDRRRQARSTPLRLLERLLGLELKMRQYEIGRAFCDAVVDRAGIRALNGAWRDAEALPTLAELRDPDGWMRRTQVRMITS
jgi:coenzyme F420 biosynthesis associated uncharacterized protein